MIPVVYHPRPKLVLTRTDSVISCAVEPRPGINLSASKTIVVIQQDDDNADEDLFNLDLALLYQTSLI